jgi:hypothetical protein
VVRCVARGRHVAAGRGLGSGGGGGGGDEFRVVAALLAFFLGLTRRTQYST